MKRIAGCLAALALAAPAFSATKILVTVIDKKSGAPVTDLKAGDFAVTADKVARQIEACNYGASPIDVALLVDSSLIGGVITPFATEVIKHLDEKEQMAIVAYDSSADLIQDFTSSKELLSRALSEVKFGNSPRMLDAIFATIDGGFQGASYRRVILLLSSGVDGPGRVSDKEVVRIARRTGVSIYPVYSVGYGRSLLERLAMQTGGAAFDLRAMSQRTPGSPAGRIFEVMRNCYTISVAGNLALGDNYKVEVPGNKKVQVSALPLD
ncbi:MAG: VWA domain-containing protein [Bryobacteraceae bacterium]|nr:VWA domain-containing protein [Bryobacteraceae bacterium]